MKWRRRAQPRPRPNVSKRGASGRSGGGLAAAARLARRVLWATGVCAAVWGAVMTYRVVAPRVATWTEVREIRVTGLEHLTQGEIVERLHLPARASMLWVNPKQLGNWVQAHPRVKAAEVTRQFPHTLDVRIVERRPAVVFRAPSGTWLLDEDGHVLSPLTATEPSDLPVLRGLDPDSLRGGLAHARRAARAGIRVAALLERSFDGRPEVDLQDPTNTVAYVDGLRFQFGPSAFEEKWDRYRKLEPHLAAGSAEGRNAAFNDVDLRYPGKVIVRDRATSDLTLARERG